MFRLISIVILFVSFLMADYETGEKIFEKKCGSCHGKYIDAKILKINFFKKNNELLKLKAPTVNMLAYALKDSPLHVGEKSDPEMQRYEISEFMKDYLFNPNKEDSICDSDVSKYYDKKESMKGEVSEEEIENIADFLFEHKEKRVKKVKKVFLKNMSIDNLIKKAKNEHKLLLIEASSKSCYYCEKMKKDVLSLPDIQKDIDKNYIFVNIDVDQQKLPLNLEKKYKKITPTFFVITPEGKLLNDYPGAWNKSDFMLILDENIKK